MLFELTGPSTPPIVAAMTKKLYWAAVILIAIAGMTSMVYFGLKPRPVPKIKLSHFENPSVLANALLMRLREELRQSPLLFLGLDVSHPEQLETVKTLLENDQEPGIRYDLVVAPDHFLPEGYLVHEKLPPRDQVETLAQGLEKGLEAGHRIAVIVPTADAAQYVSGNLVNQLKAASKLTPMSLAMTDFPRTRQQESRMTYPCIVAGVDQSGLGPFGCLVAQTARANYRKRYPEGQFVGLVEQIGLSDYLILYTQESP